jgi:cell division protein FtsQ
VLAFGLAVALGTGDRGSRLIAAGRGAVDSHFASLGFRIGAVHLQGASPAAQGEIIKAAQLTRGEPILGLDLAAVRARVERVGWVKRARVIRLLPDTVVIAIDQRRMLAVWEHAGRTAVIDDGGTVVPEADPAHFARLPLIVGGGANLAAQSILPEVLTRPRLAGRIEALVRVDDRRWDLRLKDGTLIQLPAQGTEAALIRLDQLDQQSRVLDLGLARVDLRDPEMVVVRPRASAAPGLASHGV